MNFHRVFIFAFPPQTKSSLKILLFPPSFWKYGSLSVYFFGKYVHSVSSIDVICFPLKSEFVADCFDLFSLVSFTRILICFPHPFPIPPKLCISMVGIEMHVPSEKAPLKKITYTQIQHPLAPWGVESR